MRILKYSIVGGQLSFDRELKRWISICPRDYIRVKLEDNKVVEILGGVISRYTDDVYRLTLGRRGRVKGNNIVFVTISDNTFVQKTLDESDFWQYLKRYNIFHITDKMKNSFSEQGVPGLLCFMSRKILQRQRRGPMSNEEWAVIEQVADRVKNVHFINEQMVLALVSGGLRKVVKIIIDQAMPMNMPVKYFS